jgi:hypothetical protein
MQSGLSQIAFAVAAITTFAQPAAARIVRFNCNFTSFSTPVEGVKPVKDFRLEFVLEVDTADQITTAQIIGNAGIEPVTVMSGEAGLTLLEYRPTGAVQSTTIAGPGMLAVHSRHTILGGTRLVPSQYYGTCSRSSS